MVTKEQIERLRRLAEYKARVYILRDDAKALIALLDDYARLSTDDVPGEFDGTEDMNDPVARRSGRVS